MTLLWTNERLRYKLYVVWFLSKIQVIINSMKPSLAVHNPELVTIFALQTSVKQITTKILVYILQSM